MKDTPSTLKMDRKSQCAHVHVNVNANVLYTYMEHTAMELWK